MTVWLNEPPYVMQSSCPDCFVGCPLCTLCECCCDCSDCYEYRQNELDDERPLTTLTINVEYL
jgi:hypothetical protein